MTIIDMQKTEGKYLYQNIPVNYIVFEGYNLSLENCYDFYNRMNIHINTNSKMNNKYVILDSEER